MFRCNLPPALLAEWPGDFTCHCGNTEVEQTLNKCQHTKLMLDKNILLLQPVFNNLMINGPFVLFWCCQVPPTHRPVKAVCFYLGTSIFLHFINHLQEIQVTLTGKVKAAMKAVLPSPTILLCSSIFHHKNMGLQEDSLKFTEKMVCLQLGKSTLTAIKCWWISISSSACRSNKIINWRVYNFITSNPSVCYFLGWGSNSPTPKAILVPHSFFIWYQ